MFDPRGRDGQARRARRCGSGRWRLQVEALEERSLLALSNFTSFMLHGDYVAAGVGLRDKAGGDITIAGVPADSTIKAAYLYYGYLDDGESASLKTITFAGTSFTGTKTGEGPDTCWGRTNSFGYRADVTAKVTGNGTYAITGVASGGQILAEGATLVVVYQNAASPPHQILLYDGDDVVNTSGATATNTFGGFTIVDPGTARTTFIVGDGQTGKGYDDNDSFTGSKGTRNLDNTFTGADGNYWDTATFDVSAQVAVGDTSVSAKIGTASGPDGGDCLMWVAHVLSVSSNNLDIVADTNRDGTITPADEKDKGKWTNTSGAIFNVNYTDANRDGIPDAVSFDDDGKPVNEQKTIVNAADAQQIAPVVIRALGKLPAGAKVFLKAADEQEIQSIHVYKKIAAGETAIWGGLGDRVAGGAPEPLEKDITAYVSETADTTFGVEGLFFRNTGAINTYNGMLDLTLELRDATGKVLGSDAIQEKVAPWLMISNAEASTQVWAANAGPLNAKYRRSDKADPGYVGLDNSGQLMTVKIPGGITREEEQDQWLQDHIEFGYTQRPGGPKDYEVFRLPRTITATGDLATWPLTKLLAPDVGVFAIGKSFADSGDATKDSGSFGGNLEILPPTATNKLGTIVVGDTMSTELRTFLESQQAQPVITPGIPTKWLTVGHVDEVAGFTGNGTRVALADTTLAYNLLSAIPAADREKTVFFATGATPKTGKATAAAAADNRLVVAGTDFRGQPWHYVRIYAGTGAGQVARIAAGGLRNGLIVVDKVWNTGTAITPDTIEKVPPSQEKKWFTKPDATSKFVLVEKTQFWFDENDHEGDGAPAFVTVSEVLADGNLAAVNLAAQARIDADKAALQAAAGGALTFVKVPEIFVGKAAGFDTGRSAVAFTPGLANVQQINGKLYFARQFGPKNAAGDDIFEKNVKASFADALFVDDWDLYHRLDGEVHCGSITKLKIPGVDWWTKLA
jgi:hypothetical protein